MPISSFIIRAMHSGPSLLPPHYHWLWDNPSGYHHPLDYHQVRVQPKSQDETSHSCPVDPPDNDPPPLFTAADATAEPI